MTSGFWQGRRVFVTGHTGFKGSWLCLRLARAGALLHGYSTAAPTAPNLFEVARVEALLAGHTLGDVRDAESLARALRAARPHVVFHLAAQSLVRQSYADPVATYAVNVLGTVNLLEALREVDGVRSVVIVTTDKCYENREWLWPYREGEPLGGHDPYSSSKACAELVTASYRASFLEAAGVRVATARAGNVIGGGDWAPDRLLPDYFRAADAGQSLVVRFPDAVRPWQHVLEPLAGYTLLAEQLHDDLPERAGPWNFGPPEDDARPVRWLLDRLEQRHPGVRWSASASAQPHEATTLKLDSSKARSVLGWRPRWRLEEALDATGAWHAAWRDGADMQAVCMSQIASHAADRRREST